MEGRKLVDMDASSIANAVEAKQHPIVEIWQHSSCWTNLTAVNRMVN